MSQLPLTRHISGARLLALDGGGVRGIVSLAVLDVLMNRIKEKKGLEKKPLPADYFELAGGTSTGGIIGIMLFRLRMSTQDAIGMYYKIAEDIFRPKVYGWKIPKFLGTTTATYINNSKTAFQNSRFDGEALNKSIDDVVAQFGLDESDKLLKGQAPLFHPKAGKMFVCTTAQNRAETILMRSYAKGVVHAKSIVNDVMKSGSEEVTISLAARATPAAPTYFPEVKWSVGGSTLTFWDGGLLNNNPIDQLWYSRYDLVKPEEPAPAISCVISLGTGYVRPDSPSESWFRLAGVVSSVMDFASNTNAKGKDFSRHMDQLNLREKYKNTKYIRFNPNLGRDKIDLADYTKMNELETKTRADMASERSREWVDKAVDALSN